MKRVVRRLVVSIILVVVTLSLGGSAMARGFTTLALSGSIDSTDGSRWFSDLSVGQQVSLIILMHDDLSLPHP